MARAHYWHYILNQEGQPVPGAIVRLKESGTSTMVPLYTSLTQETTASYVQSDATGFFQFWVGDKEENAGYYTNSTFDLTISGATLTESVGVSGMRFHFTPPRIFSLDIPAGWTPSGANWRQTITHNLGTLYPIVTLYNRATGQVITTASIFTVSTNSLYIEMSGDDPTDSIHITAVGDDPTQ